MGLSMFFMKICRKAVVLFFLLQGLSTIPSIASGATSSFGVDWEPQSRGLTAIVAPSTSERVSLKRFRDSKLILDTAISIVKSAVDGDPSLVPTLLWTMQFEWEASVLQPLREALHRLELIKNVTTTTLSPSEAEAERHAAVLACPALQYMLPQVKMAKAAKKVKMASRFLKAAKMSGLKASGDAEAEGESDDTTCHPAGAEEVLLPDSIDLSVDSDGEEVCSGSGSASSTVDIEAEFVATNDALALLEAEILRQLSGGGTKTVVVTKTVVLNPTKKMVMSVDEALARLAELRPELEVITAVLSAAINSMCREFSKRMPTLIMERAFLEAICGLGEATEEAREALALTVTGK